MVELCADSSHTHIPLVCSYDVSVPSWIAPIFECRVWRDCPKELHLQCTCNNIYVELAGSSSIDTQKAYRAVLKRYAKADRLRKRVDQVHVHLDTEHARDTPLTEWGPTAQHGLLGMAFPHLFPFGRTCFIEPQRRIKWQEDDFAEWLARFAWLTYTVPTVSLYRSAH